MWEGFDGKDWEVLFYDGASVIQLTDNALDDRYPEISEGQVVWKGDDGIDSEIFLFTSSCPGDFDGDGDADGSDLAVFAADFGIYLAGAQG